MAAMGEFELLARVRERLPPAGAAGAGRDGRRRGGHRARWRHRDLGRRDRRGGPLPRASRRAWRQIGRKALATALSDLAAMGAEPGEAYVVLGVPPDSSEDGCIELIDGIAALAGETGTTLAGGDVTRAPVLTVAMTVVGHAPRAGASSAAPGRGPATRWSLTGELGGAAAGLLLLERPELEARGRRRDGGAAAGPPARARCRAWRPGRALAAGRRDGDDRHQRRARRRRAAAGPRRAARGCGSRPPPCRWPTASPRSPRRRAATRSSWPLSGGEDYELLAALPAGAAGRGGLGAGRRRDDPGPGRRGCRRRGGRDQAARRPDAGAGGVRPAALNGGSSA